MKRRILIVGFVAVALLVTGWLCWPYFVAVLRDRAAASHRQANRLPDDALQALVSDPNLTLFSIDPDHGVVKSPDLPNFQRWPVLGSTTVLTAEQRQQLSKILQHGLSGWSGREIVACFMPRHALRATDGKQTFDLLICFECGRLQYYPSNDKVRYLEIRRADAGPFNEILLAAKVPMPRQPRGK